MLTKSLQAERDLIEIWVYIALDNETAADKLFDRFEECFIRLSDFPHMEAVVEGLDWLSQELRYFPVDDYIIFYRIIAQDDVEIIRVIHSSIDYTKCL